MAQSRILGLIACVLIPVSLQLLASVLLEDFSYNRWDNYEYFTPMLTLVGDTWLSGEVPYWNHHQNLGEPVLAQGQTGVYYPLYLLAHVIRILSGAHPQFLTFIIVLIHLPFLTIGWFLLCERVGIRTSLAYAIAFSASMSGFTLIMSTIWIFMIGIATWLPWICLGVWGTLAPDTPRWARPILGIALAMTAWIGHGQMLVYTALFTVLLSVTLSVAVFRDPTRLKRLILPVTASIAMAVPTLVPNYLHIEHTDRSRSVSLGEFTSRSVSPETALGLLAPIFRLYNGFLVTRSSLMLHGGSWIVPAWTAVALLFLFAGHDRSSGWDPPREKRSRIIDLEMVRIGLVFLGLGVVFLFMALGDHGLVYTRTYGIPIWSSFRWPFKFIVHVMTAFLLAGGCALEILARRGVSTSAAIMMSITIAGVVGFFAILRPSDLLHQWSFLLATISTVILVVTTPRIDRPRWRAAFLFALHLEGFSLLAMAHQMQMKTFVDVYGGVNQRALGLTTRYRYIPFGQEPTWKPLAGCHSLGLYQSATANGLHSATGLESPLAVKRVLDALPAETTGVIPGDMMMSLIGSPLLRSLNVGYITARRDHPADVDFLSKIQGIQETGSDDFVIVFTDSGALERAFFASEVRREPLARRPMPVSAGSNFPRNVIDPRGWKRSDSVTIFPYVSGMSTGSGTVHRYEESNGRIEMQVSSHGDSFLVLSVTDYPFWIAEVDGIEVPIFRVNEVVQGIRIPDGRHQVVFRCTSKTIEIEWFVALLGFCLLLRAPKQAPRQVPS